MINSLEELYNMFDQLYGDMKLICQKCTFHTCEGYLWVLPEEEARLQSSGVEIVEIFGQFGCCSIINPLDSVRPKDFESMKPKCLSLDQNGFCAIHAVRPLVCRIYPVGLLTIEDKVHVVLGRDCQYSYEMDNKARAILKTRILEIFSDCSLELKQMILSTYAVFDCYLKYPEGPNTYEDIGEFPV